MKIYKFIKLIIFIIFSILIVVFRNEAIDNLHYFVASLILAFGIENVIVSMIVLKKKCLKEVEFTFSFFEIILGLTIMTAIRNFSYVCVIWAVWSILRQSSDIYLACSEKVKGAVAIVYFIQSVVTIVFSIMLMLDPIEQHAMTHMYLVIIELLVISLPPVIDDLLSNYQTKKKTKIS